jgi:hypothetical protein
MRALVVIGLLVLAVAAAQAGASGWPPRPPARVLDAPVLLRPLPRAVTRVCTQQQRLVRFAVLCPRRLPRATYGHNGPIPRLRATPVGTVRGGDVSRPYGVDFGYSAPVEGGTDWRQHVWLNRPCCFLHFTVWRVDGVLPGGLRPAEIGGKHGRLKAAVGYRFDESSGIYWSNHDWFFWRQRGVRYAASLHFFGRRRTLALLDRLVRELRPTPTGRAAPASLRRGASSDVP